MLFSFRLFNGRPLFTVNGISYILPLLEYLWQLTRLENGNVPSLPKTLAQIQGYEYYDLLEHSNKLDGSGTKTYGILLDEINECGRKIIALLAQNNFELTTIPKVFSLQELQNIVADEMEILTVTLKYLCQVIVPNLLLTTLEIDNTIEGLNGSYIEPSPSGAPTSGGADLLPDLSPQSTDRLIG